MSWLLDNKAIRGATKKAMREGQLYGDDGEPLPEKAAVIAQLRHVVEELEKVGYKVEFGSDGIDHICFKLGSTPWDYGTKTKPVIWEGWQQLRREAGLL